MNRLISTNIQDVTPDRLPPPNRGKQTRILFINWLSLGFGTQARQFKHYAGLRDDIDAVHIDIVPPLWAKILHKRITAIGHWDFASYRILHVWNHILERWLRGPLPMDRFDVIQIMTQGIGLPIARYGHAGQPGHRPRFAVYIDATSTLEVKEHNIPAFARAPFIAAERQIFEHADLIVAMSQWAANSVIDDYSIPQSRVHVTPGCIKLPSSFSPVASQRVVENPSRCDGAKRKPRIIFIAHDWHLKGGPLLLRVHQRTLVGKAELHIVSRSAPQSPLPDVVFHGGMPWEELMALVKQMDILCHPTRMDMMCWAIVEAITSGLPVVATRMAAIPEMVLHGQTGFLCSRDDESCVENALVKLVTDAELRNRMSAATRTHAEANYNADRVYHALMDRLCTLATS